METPTAGALRASQRVMLFAAPLAACALGVALHAGGADAALAITAAVTLWCALWWVFEPVSAPITALLPLALFPLTDVLTPVQVAQAYGNELILLLGGGFMLSRALERNGAHRRLALGLARAFGGGDGRRLVYGFAAAAGLTSMWISNTATTLMLVPVALAVLERYPDARLRAPLLLAIAYGASIGGLGTPIGTPPNLVFLKVYEQTTGERTGFLEWMRIGVPVVAVFLPLAALWLARRLRGTPAAVLPVLGPWSAAERRVLTVFGVVALLWITRTEPFGGWRAWLGLTYANDAAVALLGVVAMALVPDGRGDRLLTWEAAERMPWGALVLFGGGIALASAFETSGLSQSLATHLVGLDALPLLLMMLAIAALVTLLSEIASNTATAVLMMPILAATATALDVDPALLMMPAVLAASCGFMLPVATAPNAVVYGTGDVPSRTMLREGFALDLIGIAVVTAASVLLL